jgi:hypothetical protein
MKKITLIAILLVVLTSGSAFAESGWAIGLGYNFNLEGSGSPGLLLKIPKIPLMFGIQYNFEENGYLGISADWWAYTTHLTGMLYLYLGPGVWVTFTTGGDSDFHLGMRIPVGLRLFPIKPLELFLEPALVLEFLPSLDPRFAAQIGFRFWF